MGNHLAKNHWYINPAIVYVSFQPGVGSVGDPRALNSRLKPDQATSPTDFKYLATDGSDTAPYLKA